MRRSSMDGGVVDFHCIDGSRNIQITKQLYPIKKHMKNKRDTNV